MSGPIQPVDIQVIYAEHKRQMALINEHDWKHERAARRSLRAAMAKRLLVLAQRIAPPAPEMERAMDALAR